ARTCHVLAARAFSAVEQWQKGTRGRPRFLRPTDRIALESTSIYWRGNAVEWNSPGHKLLIPAVLDPHDPDGVQAHALAACPPKHCRVLSRMIRLIFPPNLDAIFRLSYYASGTWQGVRLMVVLSTSPHGTGAIPVRLGGYEFADHPGGAGA